MDLNNTFVTNADPKPPSTFSVPPESTKRKSKIPFLKIVLILIIIFIIIPWISYIIYNFENILDKSIPCTSEGKLCPSGDVIERKRSNNCEFPICPTAKKDVSSIWKMKNVSDSTRLYENSKFIYSFQAPSDWKFKGTEFGFELLSPNFEKRGDIMGNMSVHAGSQIEYTSSENVETTENIEEWFETEGRDTFATRAPYKKNNIKFAGEDAIEISINRDDYDTKKYYFIQNNRINLITFSSYDKRSNEDYQSAFNQLITSFSFSN